MADFLVLVNSTTRRVISGGRAGLVAGSGEEIISVNPSGFTAEYNLTDHTVVTDGTIALKPKVEPEAVLPASGSWVSKQDNIIGLSGDIPDIDGMDIKWWDDSTTTLIDKTSAGRLNDSVTTGTILDETADFLYIGAHSKYSKLIVKANGWTGGTLVASYWNGAWTSLSITDNTSGLAIDGDITFTSPLDWVIGATPAGLDSSLFYIRLAFSAITTGPDLDQIVPDLGNFQENGISIDNIHEKAQSLKIILANKTVNEGLTRDISATRDSSGNDYVWATQAQIVDYTVAGTIVEGEVFHIVINGVDFNFTAPATPTVTDITAGLVAAINPHSEVTATDLDPIVRITADDAGDPLNSMDVQYFDADVGISGTLTDITDEVMLDDSLATSDTIGQLFFSAGDYMYIGQESKFTDIDVIVASAAENAGDLIAQYWDGTDWTGVSGLVDGTWGGGGTNQAFHQNGRISFDLPSDWGTGAHLNIPGLDRSILYYVRLSTTGAAHAPAANFNLIDIVNESVTNYSSGTISADRTTKNINKISLKLRFETVSSRGLYDITLEITDDFHYICTPHVLVDETEVALLNSGAFEVKDFTKSRWTRIEPAESPGNDAKVLFTADPTAVQEGFKVLLSPREESVFSPTAPGTAVANEYFVGKSDDGVVQPAKITYTKAYLTARTAPAGSTCDIVIDNIDDTDPQTVSIADGSTFKADTIALAFTATQKLAIKFGTNIGSGTAAEDVSVVLTGEVERSTNEGLVSVDPDKYIINFSSTNPDEIESVTFATAPKTDTRIFFEYAIYNKSEAKPATMSGAALTRRTLGHC